MKDVSPKNVLILPFRPGIKIGYGIDSKTAEIKAMCFTNSNFKVRSVQSTQGKVKTEVLKSNKEVVSSMAAKANV